MAAENDWEETKTDDRGNLIQGINYDDNGNIAEMCEWEYDGENRVT